MLSTARVAQQKILRRVDQAALFSTIDAVYCCAMAVLALSNFNEYHGSALAAIL